MMLYKDTLDFGFDKEDMEYVVGETKQIENYNTTLPTIALIKVNHFLID